VITRSEYLAPGISGGAVPIVVCERGGSAAAPPVTGMIPQIALLSQEGSVIAFFAMTRGVAPKRNVSERILKKCDSGTTPRMTQERNSQLTQISPSVPADESGNGSLPHGLAALFLQNGVRELWSVDRNSDDKGGKL